MLIPASTFACGAAHYLHLFDGGLTDNLGVETALELLMDDPAPRKVLLVVDAYTRSDRPYSGFRKSPDGAAAAYRVMNIGLDAQHLTLHHDVEARAAEENIQVLFMDFAQLDGGGKGDAAEAFERARNVPTCLFITSADQDALLQAGQHLAAVHKVRLREVFGE